VNETGDKWRAAIEEMPVGITIVDKERKIRDVNSAAAVMIGQDKGEILGRVCYEFVCPGREHDCPIYDHEKTFDRAEVELLSKYRGEVAIEKTVTKITVDDEEMFLEMFSDIASRKQDENSNCIQRNLALALNSVTRLNDALRLCTDAAIDISEMDGGEVYLIYGDSGSMDLAFHRGLPSDFVKSASHYGSDSDNTRLVMAEKPVYSRHQGRDTRINTVRRGENLRAVTTHNRRAVRTGRFRVREQFWLAITRMSRGTRKVHLLTAANLIPITTQLYMWYIRDGATIRLAMKS